MSLNLDLLNRNVGILMTVSQAADQIQWVGKTEAHIGFVFFFIFLSSLVLFYF